MRPGGKNLGGGAGSEGGDRGARCGEEGRTALPSRQAGCAGSGVKALCLLPPVPRSSFLSLFCPFCKEVSGAVPPGL